MIVIVLLKDQLFWSRQYLFMFYFNEPGAELRVVDVINIRLKLALSSILVVVVVGVYCPVRYF